MSQKITSFFAKVVTEADKEAYMKFLPVETTAADKEKQAFDFLKIKKNVSVKPAHRPTADFNAIVAKCRMKAKEFAASSCTNVSQWYESEYNSDVGRSSCCLKCPSC